MTVKKDRMTMLETVVDLCDKKKRSEMISMAITGLALPTECAIKEKFTLCRNDVKFHFSPSTIKLFGGFAVIASKGTIVTYEITHDSGKSCIEIDSEITKEPKMNN